MALQVGEMYPGTNERIMGMIPGSQPGTFVYVGERGGVFTDNQADFAGSYFSLDEQHRNDPDRRFTGIEAVDNGYRLLSDRPGEQGYTFTRPAQQVNRSLYEDPAFLAFMRTSGLGLETAAADVAQKENAINVALASRVAGLGDQRDASLRGVDSGFESRGLFRSSGRKNRRADEERAFGSQIGAAETGAASEIAGLKGGLAKQVAEQQGTASEKGLSINAGMYAQDATKINQGIQTAADEAYQKARNQYMSIGGK